MRIVFQTLIIMISFILLWYRPPIILELGKNSAGCIFLLLFLAFSAYISPSLAILVGAVIIVIIKEGCDNNCSCNCGAGCNCNEGTLKAHSEKISLLLNDLIVEEPPKHSEQVLTANILNASCEADFTPSIIIESDENLSSLLKHNPDLLATEENLKSKCCRTYNS